MGRAAHPEGRTEPLPLDEAVHHLLEEARTVLPGVQALFGFQLVAVFNQRFADALSPGEQAVHLAALCLVALAAGLLMTPAALHRQTSPEEVSDEFLVISGRLLLAGMVPLAVGVSLDVYLIARLILGTAVWGGLLAGGLFLALTTFWFVFPRSRRLRALAARRVTPVSAAGPSSRRRRGGRGSTSAPPPEPAR
jgi:hypothetical protein